MERPTRQKSQDKWRRIIQPAGDSDSSDWSSDSDFGLVLNRYRSYKPMAGHSSSSPNDRPMSPDAGQSNEAGASPHNLHKFFKAAEDEAKALDHPLLHHDYAESSNNNEEYVSPTHFWTLTGKKHLFLRDRQHYSNDNVSAPSDSWTEFAVNLSRRTPPPAPIRKRLLTGYSSQLSSLPGPSTDNTPSLPMSFAPVIDHHNDWYVHKKIGDTSCKHLARQPINSEAATSSSDAPGEDCSEVQIVSVMAGAPVVKKLKLCIPGTEDAGSVEVINLDETVTDKAQEQQGDSEREEKPGPSMKLKAESELLNQGIIGLLECPVCMEYMGPPINQCRRGHLICSHCKPKLVTCPTCRSRFSEQRNLAMEKVAEKLHYPCKNVLMGCTHTLRLGDREEHESNCQHRNYRCAIIPPCDWRGQHDQILPHIRSTHSEALLFGPEHELQMILGDFTEQTSQNWVVSALGQLFRVNLGAVRAGRVQVFGCVIFLGPSCQAAVYNYSLTVGPTAEDKAKRSLSFSRSTHCYVDRCSVYYSSGDCFHLRTESAQLFCVGPCNNLKIKLKIEKTE